MKKGRYNRKTRRLPAALIAVMLAGSLMLTGCGSSSGTQEQAQEETAEETAQEETAEETVQEETADGTQASQDDADKPGEAAQQPSVEAQETSDAVETAEEAPAQQAQADPAGDAAKTQETAVKQEEVKTPSKPMPAELPAEAVTAAEAEAAASAEAETTEAPAKEEKADGKEKKEEKKDKKEVAAGADSSWMDGRMTFDGMELSFPIEMTDYKLGDWTITFEEIKDLSARTVQPDEIITAVMKSSNYTDEDVIVTAEFGNYSEKPVLLSDLPMTGIYIRRGPGTEKEDGKKVEPKLPEVVLPREITWGKSAKELWAAYGEPSFSGLTNEDFDGMYENGSYYIEVAGMTDIGIDYIVYCVE